MPWIVDVLDRAVGRETLISQADAISATQEQITFAVLAHRMSRINVLREFEIHGLTPGTCDFVRVDDVVGMVGWGTRGYVYVVATLVFDQLGRPDRADRRSQRGSDRLPAHQVARGPDHYSGIGIKRREGEIVIIAVFQERRIGMIARHDGVEVGPVALVRFALTFEAAG